MFWADKIASEQPEPVVVNDSKTPSGRVHVGSLRGVVIHDVIHRALQVAGKSAVFRYGVDDFDALDTVPHYLSGDRFSPYLGAPLCNVPSPADSASDYAKYFMEEFLEVFTYLGIIPEVYYLRDFYRQGKFNPYIDLFLRHAADVRAAYWTVSKAKRPENWFPFQPICENCGKIATTVVTDYRDGQVFYTCVPNGANYVAGCGHQGWISPFDGNGKLPWKVEWVAKWDLVGVTIELAGKDHSQKGGSRDVANDICRRVLKKEPPFHAPYEFILVNGTKMSSSKGVGSSAKEIAALLPPELLRFLMLRTPPRTVINFSPNYETLTRLCRDYDTLIDKVPSGSDDPDELAPLTYAQLSLGQAIAPYRTQELGTLISLLQIPHLDLDTELRRRLPQDLTDGEWQVLQRRVQMARAWLNDYADESEKLVIHWESLPEKAAQLTDAQIAYLSNLVDVLGAITPWEAEVLQNEIFATSKTSGLSPKEAFAALYLVFLNQERGPKAGGLLSYLDRTFVLHRLKESVNHRLSLGVSE
ncbi:MAG: lysine--tRNA ligase [Oscillatoriales cyanobacterium SM2_2_1]|nr:lysine--tRNA ligase [Oscillatoriales cyanobacterium SM2_2_1]